MSGGDAGSGGLRAMVAAACSQDKEGGETGARRKLYRTLSNGLTKSCQIGLHNLCIGSTNVAKNKEKEVQILLKHKHIKK